jgi:beta-lactamase superfamily II metal-dependent hydrolase
MCLLTLYFLLSMKRTTRRLCTHYRRTDTQALTRYSSAIPDILILYFRAYAFKRLSCGVSAPSHLKIALPARPTLRDNLKFTLVRNSKTNRVAIRVGNMPGSMVISVFDVEHGQCALLWHVQDGRAGRLAMIDSGHAADFRPSQAIAQAGRRELDYLFVTNADQDHLSDLQGLWDEGIYVKTLIRSKGVTPQVLRQIKLEQCGELTNDIERFLSIHESYNSPVTEPFDTCMGGITFTIFWNVYPDFDDTNNLSLVVFFKFGPWKVLFPGDLEEAGWLALLQRESFRSELRGTDILIASHHGRESGQCAEIFNYFKPHAVVFSDKSIQHDTQYTAAWYRQRTTDHGLQVATTGRWRHVLTTRRDGTITFTLNETSPYYQIHTEYAG